MADAVVAVGRLQRTVPADQQRKAAKLALGGVESGLQSTVGGLLQLGAGLMLGPLSIKYQEPIVAICVCRPNSKPCFLAAQLAVAVTSSKMNRS
jgi:hypothetical protein